MAIPDANPGVLSPVYVMRRADQSGCVAEELNAIKAGLGSTHRTSSFLPILKRDDDL